MKCPRDDQVLSPVPVEKGAICSCARCQGVWIPWHLIETATTSRKMMASMPELLELDAATARCPQDGERLRETSRKGIRVDYCVRCKGLWLDAGELAHIRRVAAARRREEAAPTRTWGTDLADGMSLHGLDLIGCVIEWLADGT